MDCTAPQTLEKAVIAALDDLRPAMEADGGGAELVSFENESVTVQLIGSCLFCPSRKLSAAALERGLRLRVPRLNAVHIVYPK